MIFRIISKRAIISVMMATVLLFCLVSPQQYIQAETKPFLHPVFANNMVLQRDVENTIWGWTSSGEK